MKNNEKTYYTVYYGNPYFRGSSDAHFVAEFTDDDRIICCQDGDDITEYTNYESVEGYDDYMTDSYDEAFELCAKLDEEMMENRREEEEEE